MAAQAPLSVEQPRQAVIKTEPAIQAGESNSCPKCGNGLKHAAKFCGKCGFNFEQKSSHQVEELSKVLSAPIEAVVAIPSQNAVIEIVSAPPVANVDAPNAKPVAMQPAMGKPVPLPQVPMSESTKKGSSGLIIVIVVLWSCAIGGGAYWWFGLRQVAPSPVADVVNAQPTTAVVTPASAVVEPVVPPSVAVVSPPAVVNPVQQSKPQPAVINQPKNLKSHANKNGETNDDRKLLNAIDQYLDKQK